MALKSEPRSAEPASRSFLVSVRRLGTTLVSIFHSRVELLAHEIDRERARIARLLLLGVAAVFFLTLGAITATVFVIVLFWDSQRLVAIGFLTLIYLGIGGALVAYMRREAERSRRPFSATVTQLKQDREYFSGRDRRP